MDIELVSKPARDLLETLLEHKNDENCVSGREYPDLVNLDNPWLYELKELKFISTDHVPNVIFTNKGLTYPERRKAYRKEIMLTSFWLPILVSLVVSLLVSSIVVQ
ncbi:MULTISPECIES: hypothetical protein [unclassified Streptococcus]|uniref:hypothetical protein n=1 Tax=unclassified Streptococcus TaxID=2608887 RepID=UPI00211B5940|nr:MULTISPECIES: hypothetical protein [unclassified Streptococcus]MCQ9212260.1 hypothetical protein [Streptococcus sp. B01]MCQ9213591.1 hypothetical protein [Streptococcus sp. O1]